MIYQKKFLIYLTVILIGSQIIDKASGFGVVIFRNNTFDDPSFAKIENFSSCTQYSTLVKITDTNNQTAEIYLYNKPDIIEAKTGSQSDYNQTLIEIRRAKDLSPKGSSPL